MPSFSLFSLSFMNAGASSPDAHFLTITWPSVVTEVDVWHEADLEGVGLIVLCRCSTLKLVPCMFFVYSHSRMWLLHLYVDSVSNVYSASCHQFDVPCGSAICVVLSALRVHQYASALRQVPLRGSIFEVPNLASSTTWMPDHGALGITVTAYFLLLRTSSMILQYKLKY